MLPYGCRIHHVFGIDASGESEEAQEAIEVGRGQCAGQASRSAQGEIGPNPGIAFDKRFREHPAAETTKGGGASSQRGGGEAAGLLGLKEGDEGLSIDRGDVHAGADVPLEAREVAFVSPDGVGREVFSRAKPADVPAGVRC